MIPSLLTWIHLSDIHFGSGTARDGFDKSLVLERLLEDVAFSIEHDGLRPDVIFVTGDIANAGGGASQVEYRQASEWLSRLLGVAGLDPTCLFIVPGNHDVDLAYSPDGLKYVLESLRNGSETIDQVSKGLLEQLERRLDAYTNFAKLYGPSASVDLPYGSWWTDLSQPSLKSVPVSVAGLNTTLTTAIRQNEGSLQLGLAPLVGWQEQGAADRILIALSHHPVSSTWLKDFDSVGTRFQQAADIHLCGHVHDANMESLRVGGSKPMLTVVSGAAHASDGSETGFGYSFGSLMAVGDEAVVRVWPRFFFDAKQEFDRHSDLLPKGANAADYPLGENASVLLRSSLNNQTAVSRAKDLAFEDGVDDLVEMLGSIEQVDLKRFASAAMGELRLSLKKISHLRHTPEMAAGAYYAFLLPMIEELQGGQAVWAVSTMMSVEWTDDPYEERFLRANLDAADRGVSLTRVFVVPEDIVDDLPDNQPVVEQVNHSGIRTLIVVRERISGRDPELLQRIGPGMLAFDDTCVVVDRHNSDGRARGFATYSAEEIVGWKQTFDALVAHSSELLPTHVTRSE